MKTNKIIIYRLLVLLTTIFPLENAIAQGGSFGNTFYHSGAEHVIHNATLNFQDIGTGTLPGLIGTERTSPLAYLSFLGTADWVNADDIRHVDGYVRTYKTGQFIFPIGDNGILKPAAVSSASTAQPADAAYFATNPSTAITSSLKGGNEPILPNSGPFNTVFFNASIVDVSEQEYWDINGALLASITLTWDSNSDIATFTGSLLTRLTIVGWNGSQWVSIPSTVDLTSILGGGSNLNSGSITTDVSLVPNSFQVYIRFIKHLYL